MLYSPRYTFVFLCICHDTSPLFILPSIFILVIPPTTIAAIPITIHIKEKRKQEKSRADDE